eukprot:14803590-Ditylum_brightwellii.AAC.1
MRNKTNEDGYKVHQQEILTAKVEALYLLKSNSLARDKRLMFNTQEEVTDFVATHSPSYVKQWLKIWQPYFRKGVDRATAQATTNTKFLTSYSKHIMSTARVHLPRGHYTIHDGMDNDRPIDGIQSTMHWWLKQLQPNSNK